MICFADVEQLAPQWEDTKIITTDDRQTCLSQGLGRVSFCQDESTFASISSTGVVGVRKFGKPVEPKEGLGKIRK